MTAVARNGAAESRSFGFNWSGFVLNLYLGVFFLYPSWHFFGLTGPDRGMFSASKHNILGSVMA